MGVLKKLMVSDYDNSVWKFTIDTRNTGGSNTDANPLVFRLPTSTPTSVNHRFILRVSDGRPDYSYNGGSSETGIINFSSAGIYQITIIGYVDGIYIHDKLKWISIDLWGNQLYTVKNRSFDGCANLIIKAKNSTRLAPDCSAAFRNIKGFDSEVNLNQYDVSSCVNLAGLFSGISMPFYSVLNAFYLSATNLNALYDSVNLSNVPEVNIVAPKCTQVRICLRNSQFSGRLIIHAPINSYFQLLYGVTTSISLGEIDVRVADDFNNWISVPRTQNHTDATLLGWVNNFDWSATPVIARTVNFYGSKYSNNPSVISAKNFLQSKGFTFANLTMA